MARHGARTTITFDLRTFGMLRRSCATRSAPNGPKFRSYFRDTPETPSDGLFGTTLTLGTPCADEHMPNKFGHRGSSGYACTVASG